MYFCIRDDDTSYFTSPDNLENAYGEISRWGPVSLAVVPFHCAGTSKAVPEKFRGQWSVHPLHENTDLVHYLRDRVVAGRFEIMLHGFHHDIEDGSGEFAVGSDLTRKAREGRQYLESLLKTTIRVFVPPRNAISYNGLQAVIGAGLHLGGSAGIRGGWPLLSRATWQNWFRLKLRKLRNEPGCPWVIRCDDHHEIPGNAITPLALFDHNKAVFADALAHDGVFCAATHYWELATPSRFPRHPTVGEHLRHFAQLAHQDARIGWRSVGDIVSDPTLAQ